MNSNRFLFIIMGVSLIIRMIIVSDSCLFWDELFSVTWNRDKTVLQTVSTVLKEDVHPPLYYLLVRPFLDFGLDLETALRLPSVFLGTAGIYTTFLAAQAASGTKAGVFAAVLTCFNPMHFYHSIEGRMYTLFYLLCSLFLYFWIRKIKCTDKNYCNLLIISVISFYCHYYFVFPYIFFSFIELLIALKKNFFLKYLTFQLLLLIFISPLVVSSSASPLNMNFFSHLSRNAGWLSPVDFSVFYSSMRTMLEGYYGSMNYFWGSEIIFYGFLSILLILSKKSPEKKLTALTAGFVFFPGFFLYLTSQITGRFLNCHLFETRHLMMALPALMITCGFLLSRLSISLQIITLSGLVLVFSQETYQQYLNSDDSFKKAWKYISEKSSSFQTVCNPFSMLEVVRYYIDNDSISLILPGETSDEAILRLRKSLTTEKELFLIWRNAGQRTGTGTDDEIELRNFLIDQHDLEITASFHTPHAEGGLQILNKNQKDKIPTITNTPESSVPENRIPGIWQVFFNPEIPAGFINQGKIPLEIYGWLILVNLGGLLSLSGFVSLAVFEAADFLKRLKWFSR